jgi:hypothetical protein
MKTGRASGLKRKGLDTNPASVSFFIKTAFPANAYSGFVFGHII